MSGASCGSGSRRARPSVDAPASGSPLGGRRPGGWSSAVGGPRCAIALKVSFELAEGYVDVAVEDVAELLCAGAVGPVREDGFDCPWGGAVADAGFVAGPGEGIRRQLSGEVDERARHGCDGDAPKCGRIAGIEGARSVGCHSFNAPLGAGDDLGRRSSSLEEYEQMRGRAPAEQRALPRRRPGRWLRCWGRGGRRGRRRGAHGSDRRSATRHRICSSVTPARSSSERVTTPWRRSRSAPIPRSTVLPNRDIHPLSRTVAKLAPSVPAHRQTGRVAAAASASLRRHVRLQSRRGGGRDHGR